MGSPTFISKKEKELQSKLKIGVPNDIHEKKADQIANDVIKVNSSGEGAIQRKCNECDDELQMKPLQSTTDVMIQKQDEDENDHPYQLTMPEIGSSLSYKPNLSFGIPELKLDPKIAFEIKMMEIRRMLSIDLLKQQAPKINTVYGPQLPPTYGLQLPPAYNPQLLPPTPSYIPSLIPNIPPLTTPKKPEPKDVKPRKGSPGDIVKAIMGIPVIKTKLEEIQATAEKYAENTYNGLSTGGKVGVISGAVTLAGGTVAGLLVMPREDRLSLLDPLSGVAIPIPGTPVSVTYTSMDMKKIVPSASDNAPKVEQVMIGVNVGKILPKSWGFK
ncbi:hypothetical protein D1818_23325 [Aquimarina sp. BL5]|uniref:hypothetical protein n=1 Tax=Aquimarina sp. BL5 TaxID=1714860 RepID=UPI000E5413B0|nr:hypothetical protein [Aquimarina sp. BL5]AXT53611.1 hypothetical protein D1818_23325 [Aquimarina sp. BL5]RKM97616.1 hypothetical protein D7036_20445 [Aquimarina sp. BL5]